MDARSEAEQAASSDASLRQQLLNYEVNISNGMCSAMQVVHETGAQARDQFRERLKRSEEEMIGLKCQESQIVAEATAVHQWLQDALVQQSQRLQDVD